jgi:hypothetical protein
MSVSKTAVDSYPQRWINLLTVFVRVEECYVIPHVLITLYYHFI